ncbi:hypothetical protein [Hahella sp. CCB-MM4]|uniref:hypothetical protein n=1 Tax=Hahella sp. (strain CCB-MM4) TaxID=1926491 RepID=UPI0011400992|nr:hypothetical protein [Hahella sp. CCB-MM4]
MENLWPYLKIDSKENGSKSIYWRSQDVCHCESIATLKNSLPGTWYLVANGPSVSNIDFNKLRDKQLCGVNASIALTDKYDIHFDAYVVIDPVFIDKNYEMMRKILLSQTKCFMTVYCIISIYHREPELLKCSKIYLVEHINRRIFKPVLDIHSFRTWVASIPSLHFSETNTDIKIGCSEDISLGIFDGGTVAVWALQILAYAGASNINLLGVDIRGQKDRNRFFEDKDNKQPSDLMDKYSTIIEPSLKAVKECCENKGITLRNYSPNSIIPESLIEKADPSDLLIAPPHQITKERFNP